MTKDDRLKIVRAWVIFAGALILAYMGAYIILRLTGFKYECIIYKYTGLYCISCGSTRAVSALLEGNIFESLEQNISPVFIVLSGIWITSLYTLSVVRHRSIKISKTIIALTFIIAIAMFIQMLIKDAMILF